MGFRLVAIDNANEKDWAALLNILWVSRTHRGLADIELSFRHDLFFFNTVCVDECFWLSDGLRVRMFGGVNEIADTLGVNEGLEGEG